MLRVCRDRQGSGPYGHGGIWAGAGRKQGASWAQTGCKLGANRVQAGRKLGADRQKEAVRGVNPGRVVSEGV
ncbi:hypothetical protein [Desulfovibrio psychrotolerans]|uniref:hypothetical protein n=1 Tax=Desulfovibrio psychrotolerans TaxID=415242 RepID=UPI00157A3CC4|nr:hypothetical protein [Desulfovibrio psychrotolerans]